MKMFHRIALLWLLCFVVILPETILKSTRDGTVIVAFLIQASSALIGIVAYHLWKKDIHKKTRWVFFNLAVFFLWNAFASPLWYFLTRFTGMTGDWLEIFYIQYFYLAYFLFLFICVLYVVVDDITARRGIVKKYAITLFVTASVWGLLSYPFFTNPKFLLTEPNYRDFNSVREAVRSLQDGGKSDAGTELIATEIDLLKSDYQPPLADLSGIEKQHRIEEILPYVPGKNGYLIFFAPLWIRCSMLGVLSVLLLLWSSVRHYIVDSQKGAYVEKIAWCLILYCILKALHFYVYTKVKDHDSFTRIDLTGSYLSLVVMWILGGLFALRLHFIQSVEGSYYERHLVESADGITRWRDALDNWLLKTFMNPRELDRRFLVHRRTKD